MSGTGSPTIQGTGGGVTLTGNSSGFAGNTLVSGVALVIGPPTAPGASLGSSVTVQNGGTVSGLGTIGSSLANASGTVMPGGTIGTLTVGGNLRAEQRRQVADPVDTRRCVRAGS